MKFKSTILATLIAATGLSAFAQGFINFQGSNPIFDVNNQVAQGVGNGKRATTGLFDVAFLWNASTNQSLDTMQSSASGVGSTKVGAANKESATNGVYSTSQALANISSMLAAGWQWGSNSASSSFISTATVNPGSYNYNVATPVGLVGTTAGETIQLIVVAWNASAGLTAILSGNVAMFGYSNPILYALGLNSADGPAFVQQTGSGMNEFGVAPAIPEPTTLALAGIGAAMLIFRKRKE